MAQPAIQRLFSANANRYFARTAFALGLGFLLSSAPLLRAQQPTFNDITVASVPTTSGTPLTLRMDIYKPTNATSDTPVVAWIYGGGWTQGSYNAPLSSAAADLLNQGIAIAHVSYRLSQESIFPAQIQDVKACIRQLREGAATYGIDPRRIASWGPSAGGHLSALLATSGGVTALEGTSGSALGQSSRILAAVDYFGPTDILNMNLDITNPPGSGIDHDAPSSPESRLIGFSGAGQGIGLLRANLNNPSVPYPELLSRAMIANSVTHVAANDPVMFIAHGTIDTSVPLKQSTRLSTALNSAGVPNVYLQVPGRGHGDLGATTDSAARAFLVEELTRPFGDASRDGSVNFSDLLLIAQNFGSTSASWRQGDFTSDGLVDSVDLSLVAGNYGSGFNADWQRALTSVPEPSSLLLMWATLLVIPHRSKRSQRNQPTDFSEEPF